MVKSVLSILALGLLIATSDAAAQSGQFGPVCVGDVGGSFACTALDVRITSIVPLSILESCVGNSTATAVFDVTIAAASIRQDISVFVALDGGTARESGFCFHDYLQPPLVASPSSIVSYHGPWRDKDADACGDMDASSEIVKDLNPGSGLTIPCIDADQNGIVDVGVCVGWDNSTANVCTGVSNAIPQSSSKCWCGRMDVGVPTGGGGSLDGLALERNGSGTLTLSWGGSCNSGDTDFEVYEGDLGTFSMHRSVLCSTGGTRSASLSEPSGSVYYLVVPRTTGSEGSYGRATSGERPVGTSACAPQQVSPCVLGAFASEPSRLRDPKGRPTP